MSVKQQEGDLIKAELEKQQRERERDRAAFIEYATEGKNVKKAPKEAHSRRLPLSRDFVPTRKERE